jgi:hypothetical protein
MVKKDAKSSGNGSGDGEYHMQGGPPNKQRKVTGRTCMECGATSTPQWREGPSGGCGAVFSISNWDESAYRLQSTVLMMEPVCKFIKK